MKATREMIIETSRRILGPEYTESQFLPMILRELCIVGFTSDRLSLEDTVLIQSAYEKLSTVGYIPEEWDTNEA